MTEPVGGVTGTHHSASHSLPRLHRPNRWFVALAEVAAAALLVWAAFLCWDAAKTAVTLTLPNGAVSTSEVMSGTWISGAVVIASIAGLLLLDAIRQTMLAIYAPHRRPKNARAEEDEIDEF